MNRIAPLFLGAAWFASSIAHAAEACRLPEPSGPYGIGGVAYDWTDNSRSDTLGADPKRNRGAGPLATVMPVAWSEAGELRETARALPAVPGLLLKLSLART